MHNLKTPATVAIWLLSVTAGCNRTPKPLRVVLLAPPEARRLIQGEVLSFGAAPRSIASGREIQLLTMVATDDVHYRDDLRRFDSDLQVVIVSDSKEVPSSSLEVIPICHTCQRKWYAYIPNSARDDAREGAQVILEYFREHDPTSSSAASGT